LALPKPRLIEGGNPSKPVELHNQITQALGYK